MNAEIPEISKRDFALRQSCFYCDSVFASGVTTSAHSGMSDVRLP